MKKILIVCSLLLGSLTYAQNWQSFVDSIPTLSSPRSADLNNDGILDVVIGGGTDGVFSNNGIMAFNGIDGSILWTISARNEVFGSAIFQDITMDGIEDVFIVGRSAQLLAINGSSGAIIWDYFPYGTNPVDSGLYNFYNPQFIQDVDGDSYKDILVSNGGDHLAPAWETDRPPGLLMVVSSLTGGLISQAIVPDSAEIYCSPLVIDVQNDGNKWILYGTGGENLGGHFYAAPLNDLIAQGTLTNSVILAQDPNKGFIAPASVYRKNNGVFDLYIQSFGGVVTKINGEDLTSQWTYAKPNTESSAAPVIGNFVGDLTPDVLLVLFKGSASSYSDFYQVVLDGATGNVEFIDSIGSIHFASANAADLNNDGRDEAIFALSYMENSYFRSRVIAVDFISNAVTNLDETRTGVNIGSTPQILDIDNNGLLDIIYSVKKDSLNPMGWKGIYVYRHELTSTEPNAGTAWGSYMGSAFNGVYEYVPSECGPGSVISSILPTSPTCNGSSNGSISVSVIDEQIQHTYLWSTGSTGSSLQNVSAGTYWVQVTNDAGCFETQTITLTDPFVITFGGIAAPTCIGGSNGMATLNSTGCYCMFSSCTFLWENGGTTKPNNALQEGWNSVIITHSNGCVVEDSVFIPSPAPVIDSISIQHVELCYGDQSGSAIVHYSQNPQTMQFAWSNGGVNDTLTDLSAGEYYVIIEDSRPCRDSIAFTITQPDSLQFTLSSTNVTCSGNSDGSITNSVTGGTFPYTYFVNGFSISNSLISGLAANDYEVYIEDNNGCVSDTLSATITQPTPLSLVLVGTPSTGLASFDGMAQATMTGGTQPYEILWNDVNGQMEDLAVYLNPGWVTATVTDANWCTIVDSVYIGMVGISDVISDNWNIFPNPTSDKINLPYGIDQLIIYDAKGAVVRKEENPTAEFILLLSAGMYTLEAKVQTAVLRTKLVVE
jgi:hypothetical protein